MIEIENCRPSEAALLASMIIKPDVIPSVLEIIEDENDFIFPEHQIIFLVIFRLWLGNVNIDGLLVRDELIRQNQFEKIGGVSYFQELIESAPSAASAVYYAKAVKSHKVKRDIISAGEEIEKASHIDENDLAIEKMQSIANGLQNTSVKQACSFKQAVDQVIAEQNHPQQNLRSGFRDIDYYLGGFEPGQLVILAARPSMGKSALAFNIATNIAKADKKVLFFSFEATQKEIIRRALLSNSQDELRRMDFKIDENCSSIDQLIAFVKGRKKLYGIDAVFIDYLQLMTAGKSENRTQEISIISRKLKLLAMGEDIPVVALSQLNRAVEQRTNRKPCLADLRESGSIEQDADVVLLLTRGDFYRTAADPKAEIDNSADIIIAKNRSGKTGAFEMVFVDEKVSFFDKARL